MANCKYAQVDCIAGCGQKVQRRKITEHVKKDCIKRWVKCPRCKKETTFENLQVSVVSRSCSAYTVDKVSPPYLINSMLLTAFLGVRAHFDLSLRVGK